MFLLSVISRNILNEVDSLPLLEDPVEDDPMSSEPLSPASEHTPADADVPQPPEDWTGDQRNGSAAPEGDADVLSVSLTAPAAAGNTDAAKPPHADEM